MFLKYPNKIFHFSNEKNFSEWVLKQDFEIDLLLYRKKIKELSEYALMSNEVKYFEEHGEFSPEFSQKINEIIEHFTPDKQAEDMNAARLGVARLYDKTYFRDHLGNYWITANVGSKARNKAESIRQIGILGSYYTRTWWRGRVLFLLGTGFAEDPDLGPFNNDIESIFFH